MPVKPGEPVNYQSSRFACGISVNLPLVLVQCWHVSWKHTFSKLLVVPGLLETEFAPLPLTRKFWLSLYNLAEVGAMLRQEAMCSLFKWRGWWLVKVTPKSQSMQKTQQISPDEKCCSVAQTKEEPSRCAINHKDPLASAVQQEIPLQNSATALPE